MKSFLMTILLLCGTIKAYAIQKQSEASCRMASMVQGEPSARASLRTRLLSKESQVDCRTHQALASGESKKVSGDMPTQSKAVVDATYDKSRLSSFAAPAKAKMRYLPKTLYEEKNARRRPLPSNKKESQSAVFSVQRWDRSSQGFSDVVPPSGGVSEKVARLAWAIAKAEGFFLVGAKPQRLHNPGDFRSSSRHAYPGQVGIDRSGYVIFKSDRYGWAALESAINKIITGDSVNYNVNMTLKQLAKKYATSPTWIKNVAKNLGCEPNTPLWEILDVPPVVQFKQNTLLAMNF